MAYYRVLLTEEAERDMATTQDFMASQSVQRSQKWFDGVFGALETLHEMPACHGLVAEADQLNRPLRALNYASHRIIYEIGETLKLVTVYRVYHFARAPLRVEDLKENG